MATTYYSDGYYNPSYSSHMVGVTLTREFKFTVTVANVINDVIKLAVLPPGIILDEFYVNIPDMDTSTGFVCALGDDTTANTYVSGSSVGQAAGQLDLDDAIAASLPAKYTVKNSFNLKVTTAASGTAATTGAINGWIRYHYFGATNF